MSFKVGDKVKCVDPKQRESRLAEGKIYEIRSTMHDLVTVCGDDEAYFEYRFVLVDEDALIEHLEAQLKELRAKRVAAALPGVLDRAEATMKGKFVPDCQFPWTHIHGDNDWRITIKVEHV